MISIDLISIEFCCDIDLKKSNYLLGSFTR